MEVEFKNTKKEKKQCLKEKGERGPAVVGWGIGESHVGDGL